EVAENVALLQQRSLRRVINATGIIVHTNLGRAPLAPDALAAAVDSAAYYSNLEFDIISGERGSRTAPVEELLRELTGAPSAFVVNNNAAAVLLCLHCFARNKEVIVSRGELMEIGGSFRIPDILAQSGAQLCEVGTTNRTRISDYRQAITDQTAMLFKAHTSNYRIVGFAEEVALSALAGLGRQHGLPVMLDMGSGNFLSSDFLGLPDEPTVQAAVKSGIDLVSFSGDKLLGGPQAGIIVGRTELIERI
ncbi:MAG: L-seryl-tRNA(Sec) selenium transferase, partial [Deltaproteobacteria bacterium]|nr:L-seryl-tRNA(Sec) selenium transferase [Deltaproteobacteria bacterium]